MCWPLVSVACICLKVHGYGALDRLGLAMVTGMYIRRLFVTVYV
jgi:hypothetical protein